MRQLGASSGYEGYNLVLIKLHGLAWRQIVGKQNGSRAELRNIAVLAHQDADDSVAHILNILGAGLHVRILKGTELRIETISHILNGLFGTDSALPNQVLNCIDVLRVIYNSKM